MKLVFRLESIFQISGESDRDIPNNHKQNKKSNLQQISPSSIMQICSLRISTNAKLDGQPKHTSQQSKSQMINEQEWQKAGKSASVRSYNATASHTTSYEFGKRKILRSGKLQAKPPLEVPNRLQR